MTIHYLLLPAIITSFCKRFLSPFLAPQLDSDFHFVKSNKQKKRKGSSCLRAQLLIKSHRGHSTTCFLRSLHEAPAMFHSTNQPSILFFYFLSPALFPFVQSKLYLDCIISLFFTFRLFMCLYIVLSVTFDRSPFLRWGIKATGKKSNISKY